MSRFGLFWIEGFGFAVALEQIKKILQNSTTYKLPHLPGAVSAVLIEAGQLVPLLDLSQLVGTGTQLGQVAQGYQVLVESEYGTVALPADLTGKIVTEQKGELSVIVGEEEDFGTIGKLIYRNEEYNILDINILAIEMTQGFWQSQPGTGGARRHQ